MRIRRFAKQDLATVYVAALVEHLLRTKPRPVLGLATGSTPVKLYRQLVDFHQQGLTFRHVTTINLDEYVGLPANHPQSYARFMQEHLLSLVDIEPGHAHIPDGTSPDLERECARYDAVLEENPIDLQILGIGRNGHIGFNEPDEALQARTHVIDLSQDTIRANARFFSEADAVPTRAITMGIQSILQSREIVLMAFGRDKAEAVRQALLGQVSPVVPASFLQMHANVTFVLDREAAALLDAVDQPALTRMDREA